MKTPEKLIQSCLLSGMLLVLCLAVGCSSAESVAKSEGHGKKRIFPVPYETAWAATSGAAEMDDYLVLKSDKQAGFILIWRSMGDSTFGNNVAIWVHPLSARQTSVEVVSRPAGPPVLPPYDLETLILKNIGIMLDD